MRTLFNFLSVLETVYGAEQAKVAPVVVRVRNQSEYLLVVYVKPMLGDKDSKCILLNGQTREFRFAKSLRFDNHGSGKREELPFVRSGTTYNFSAKVIAGSLQWSMTEQLPAAGGAAIRVVRPLFVSYLQQIGTVEDGLNDDDRKKWKSLRKILDESDFYKYLKEQKKSRTKSIPAAFDSVQVMLLYGQVDQLAQLSLNAMKAIYEKDYSAGEKIHEKGFSDAARNFDEYVSLQSDLKPICRELASDSKIDEDDKLIFKDYAEATQDLRAADIFNLSYPRIAGKKVPVDGAANEDLQKRIELVQTETNDIRKESLTYFQLIAYELERSRRSETQSYSRWRDYGTYFVSQYQFTPYGVDLPNQNNVAIFFPNQPRYIYFFNTHDYVYWGRYDITEGPLSELAWQWYENNGRIIVDRIGTAPQQHGLQESTQLPLVPYAKDPGQRLLWPNLVGLPIELGTETSLENFAAPVASPAFDSDDSLAPAPAPVPDSAPNLFDAAPPVAPAA